MPRLLNNLVKEHELTIKEDHGFAKVYKNDKCIGTCEYISHHQAYCAGFGYAYFSVPPTILNVYGFASEDEAIQFIINIHKYYGLNIIKRLLINLKNALIYSYMKIFGW